MTTDSSGSSGPTVLVAEDSPTQARRTQIDLEAQGFRVVIAENGRVALALASESVPDAILSDVLMPEVDGFRLCLEARMDRRLRSVPIILRSSQFAAPEDRGLARAAGADAYIQKDLTATELASVIRETIEAGRDEKVFFDPDTFRSEYGTRLLAKLVQEAADLERANERLVENQARLQGVLDNAPTNITVKDLNGHYLIANPQFQQFVGMSLDALVGKTDDDFFPPTSAAHQQENDRKVIETGSPLEFEEELPSNEGMRFFASVKFPLFDAKGNVQGICTISSDVTERRKLEQDLREFQKMETIGLLAGGVAHDFGNYLSAITTYASFLEEEIEADDPRHEDVSEIKKAAESATRLARQLMTLSRKEAIAPEVVDLNGAIGDISRLLSIAVGTDMTVEVKLAEDLPPITINPGHLEQILMNFAVNARDAMSAGGTFTIETTRATHSEEGGGSQDDLVRLRISDTGHGMDPDTIGRIFDPFFTTKSRTKGTGLGLATVKKVIDAVGGTISVRSVPGDGTTFDIVLPPAGAAPRTPTEGLHERSGSGRRVLIVDDDPNARTWIEKVLAAKGFETLVAPTAAAAEEILERKAGTIDLLIVDVFLPGRTGRDLVKDVKERLPELEVIFISGLLEAAFPDGRIDYDAPFIEKPIDADVLLRNVKELLEARAGSEANS